MSEEEQGASNSNLLPPPFLSLFFSIAIMCFWVLLLSFFRERLKNSFPAIRTFLSTKLPLFLFPSHWRHPVEILQDAARRGNLDMVQEILGQPGTFDINAVDGLGNSPLLNAYHLLFLFLPSSSLSSPLPLSLPLSFSLFLPFLKSVFPVSWQIHLWPL